MPDQPFVRPIVHVAITGDSGELQSVHLTQDVTRIGRGHANHVVLRNKFISTAHAELRIVGKQVFLRDLRSVNGSRIRRNRWIIPMDQRCGYEAALEDGDDLLLGDDTHPVTIRVTIAGVVKVDVESNVTVVQALRSSEVQDLPRRMDREAFLAVQDLAATLRPHATASELSRDLCTWVLKHMPVPTNVAVHLLDPATGLLSPVGAKVRDGEADTTRERISAALRTEVMRRRETFIFLGDMSASLHERSIREGLCAPLMVGDMVIGIVQADRRMGASVGGLGRRDLELVAVAARQAAMALELSRLEQTYRTTVESAIGGIIAVMESRDTYMAGHAAAVSVLAGRLATRLRMSEEDIARVQRAGALHEIGRFAVPAEILNEPGKLTEDQFRRIRTAPLIAVSIVERFGFLADLVPIVRHLHERWDGNGYPDGLSGDAIPLPARVVAVADAFHTLVSHRSYQEALTQSAALRVIGKAIGTQFDPRIVGVLELMMSSSDETWEHGAATSIGFTIENELLARPGK